MKRHLLWLLLLGASCLANAQPQALIDSLLQVTQQAPHDSIRAEAFVHLVAHHRYQKEEAIDFAKQGIATAEQAKFTRGLYNLYNQLGVVYDVAGDYALALQAYQEALLHAMKLKRPDLIGALNTNMGLSQWNIGNFDQALRFYFAALEQFEKSTNKLTLPYIANTYNNIGLIYYDKNDVEKAAEFNQKALAIFDTLPESYDQAAAYTNKANIHSDRKELDLAIENYLKAHDIHSRIGNDYGMGMVLYNVSRIYSQLEKYGLALEYAQRCLDARTRAGDRAGVAAAHMLLSGIYSDLNQKEEAYAAQDTALAMAKDLNSKLLLMRVYRNRANNFEANGQYKKALDAHKLFKLYADSMKMEQTDKQVRELEVKFDVAQKDQIIAKNELALLDQKIEIQRRTYLAAGLTVLIALLVILGLVLRSRYRYKQKELLAQERLVERQARIEAVISAQEAEKTRFAADLHDGMGQLLTALRLSLGGDNPQTSESIVDELYRELRHLAYNIMPQTLVKKGLSDALKELCDRIDQTENAPRVTFNSFGMENRLPQAHEQLLYRVVQELFTNILKYAGAEHISLNLVAANGELNIMLEDDGQGFNPALLKRSKGHGWANIQSRLDMLQAEIDVDSRPERRGSSYSINLQTD